MSVVNPLRILSADNENQPEPITQLFHRLDQVVPENRVPGGLPGDTKAAEAIQQMVRDGCAQMPVKAGQTVIGVFSFRSFALNLLKYSDNGVLPADLLVEECVEDPRYAYANDDYPPFFQQLAKDGFLFLGDPDRLQAVVTPMDILRYLYNVAYPFVLLNEIERVLRRLILHCVSEQELPRLCAQAKVQKCKLEDMVFQNYIALITSEANWPTFQKVFGGARTRVEARLVKVRQLRNDAFHFKRELTDDDRNELQDTRNWILRRALAVEAALVGGAR
jgi:hypothetical protein